MSDGKDRDRPQAPAGYDPAGHNAALGRAMDRARLVILWERAWPRLVLFLGILGGVLALSWLGFWQVVPYWARGGGVLSVLALLFAAAWPLITLRRPSDKEALRRIDAMSAGGHRPATALADDLATRDDPFARALWEEHRSRTARAAGRLRTGLPMPRMPHRDRYAVRALALLLIVPAYFLAGDERVARLMTAFDWRAPPAPIHYRIDAWVTPPAYTGRPPVILPTRRSGDMAASPADPETFRVPAGSVVTLRVAGLADVGIAPEGGVAAAPPPELPQAAATTAPQGGNLAETRWTVTGDGGLTLRGAGAEPLSWRFEAIADRAPTIAFERDPHIDQRNQFALSYKVEDDYGVTEAEAQLSLAPSAAALQREGARPLAELPPIPLGLPQARTRAGSGQTVRDFAAHPFAGLQVAVKLRARDDSGNEGFSETAHGTLPQRVFSKPIPRALVEQRRILALDAHAKDRVARALEALTIAPDHFKMEAAVYLGLRTAYFRLVRARDDEALKEVLDYLWDIAVRMEDGDVSEAEQAVSQAAERLRQAIERGASQEEIRRLSQELRQAMNRLMRELAEQAMRNRQDGRDRQQAQRDPNTRTVSPQDLRDMLNRIENLARSGAREQAQRLMQELQQMLQGLQAGRQQQQQGEMGESGEQGESPLDRLADMIRRQQQLRDDTFRRNQEQRRAQRGQQRPGQRGQEGQQGQQGQRQPGESGEGTPDFDQLGDAQRQLRELLDQLREQLGRQGEGGEGAEGQSEAGRQAQEGMGNAGRAMREAEERLGQGDGQGATDAQGRALRNLQRGAQGLAQQMQEGQGQPGQQGQNGQQGQPGRSGQAGNQDYDPLGRPTRGREANENSDVRIPNAGEGAAQRAQRVLEELRRRLSDPERPQVETDYIERLLRGLQIQ